MSFRHMLIALDFSPTADRVLQRAVDLAGSTHATITLLHVVDYLPPLGFADDFTPSPAVMVDEQSLVQGATRTLERYAERFGLGEGVAQVVRVGPPRQEIVKLASERGVDLIVIGSHGRHGLRRLLGSTANAVLNDATCDVLAVRAND
jgi:universal stress protein A